MLRACRSPQAVLSPRLLAFAVFRQAIIDALDPSLPAAVRRGARRFLVGTEMSRFWAVLATGGRQARR